MILSRVPNVYFMRSKGQATQVPLLRAIVRVVRATRCALARSKLGRVARKARQRASEDLDKIIKMPELSRYRSLTLRRSWRFALIFCDFFAGVRSTRCFD